MFGGENVAIADRVIKNGLLSVEFRRNPDGSLLSSPEFPHLKKTRDQMQAEEQLEHLCELKKEGKKVKEICETLGISRRNYFYLKKKTQND